MNSDRRHRLFRDLHMPWPGEFPYDLLNRRLRTSGFEEVGPESSAKAIGDAFFDLMTVGRPSQEERLAWDHLRLQEKRLLVDFFLYQVESSGEDVLSQSLWDCAPPIWHPDYLALADVPVDMSQVQESPMRSVSGSRPGPLQVEPDMIPEVPVDIGAIRLDINILLGADDD